MKIEFENAKLKNWLMDEAPYYNVLNKKINKVILKSLIKRKNELLASPNFYSFLCARIGKPHSLENNDQWYSIHLNGNYRLIIKPKSNDISPETLKKCDTIIMIGVDDYHGGKTNWILP